MSIQQEFIEAMRGIAATVSVISSQNDTTRQAMTASAVTSLSLNPPSMLICVNEDASIHKLLNINNYFCINVLNSKQQDIAKICSAKEEGEFRFSTDSWLEDELAPYLEKAQANIFCKCFEKIKHSTHTVFLGKVIKVLDNGKKDPLIYVNGDYKSIRI